MHRLQRYGSPNASYVLVFIRRAIIAFQLTPEGERKLSLAGIAAGNKFQFKLLLDLFRSGDAFTGGGLFHGPESPFASQLETELSNEPELEALLPACSECPSMEDLHLSFFPVGEEFTARLQCSKCRANSADLGLSIPVSMLSTPFLTQTLAEATVTAKHANLHNTTQAAFTTTRA